MARDNWGLVPLTHPHPCTISRCSRSEKKSAGACAHTHTHTRTHTKTWRNGEAGLNKVRQRGSGGHVCKPHTPSRMTKVTKEMCTILRPIPLSKLAFSSLHTAGKHAITQQALHSLLFFFSSKSQARKTRWQLTSILVNEYNAVWQWTNKLLCYIKSSGRNLSSYCRSHRLSVCFACST